MNPRILALAAALAAWAFSPAAPAADTLHHVHGLAFSADGARLLIPAHYGLAVWNAGRWSKAPGPEHDYMGFYATRSAFYTSGHPARGSGLVNPFGLMKSEDGGATWRKLGLEGESDFHVLAASYETNAVYVYNHGRNSRMAKAGLYATDNDGLMWRAAQAVGLEGEVAALAVHPKDKAVVAAATDAGLFLSRDGGGQFRRLAAGQTLSVLFDLDGETLWAGGYASAPTLIRYAWRSGKAEALALPALGKDAVAYVAQNPARKSEYAIATFERSVFLSRNAGKTWSPLAERGRGK